MGQILFKNLELLNVIAGTLTSGLQVLVQDDQIVKVGQGAARSQKAEVINLGGRTLMPGLIDCHTHILGWAWGLWGPPKNLPSFATAYASDILAPATDARLHHRTRYRRGRPRTQTGRGPRTLPGSSSLRLGTRDQPDRGTRGCARPSGTKRSLRLRPSNRRPQSFGRRRDRSSSGHPRRNPAGRRPDQDHGGRRDRVRRRSHRPAAVFNGGVAGRGR